MVLSFSHSHSLHSNSPQLTPPHIQRIFFLCQEEYRQSLSEQNKERACASLKCLEKESFTTSETCGQVGDLGEVLCENRLTNAVLVDFRL